MDTIYLVGLVSSMLRYRALAIGKSRTVAIGEPILERSGVVGRRALVAYPFSGPHVIDLERLIGLRGDGLALSIVDEIPADWRWSNPS